MVSGGPWSLGKITQKDLGSLGKISRMFEFEYPWSSETKKNLPSNNMVYLPTWKPYKSTKCWGTIPYMDPMGTDLSFKCHTVWVPYSMWILDPKLMLSQIVDSICVFFVMKRPRLTLAYLWIFAFRLGCTWMHQKTLLVIGNIHNF